MKKHSEKWVKFPYVFSNLFLNWSYGSSEESSKTLGKSLFYFFLPEAQDKEFLKPEEYG